MNSPVISVITNIAGVFLQFCQAVSALLMVNVDELLVNGLTIDFNNPFGIALADISLPGLGSFGQGIVDLFATIPGASLDITFLQFLFNVAVLTVIIRIISSVTVR